MSECGTAIDVSDGRVSVAALALPIIRACGFVILSGVFPPAMIGALAHEYTELASLPGSALLDGRHEWLPPFQLPFNSAQLLHHPALFELAEGYLGRCSVDLDAVTVITAPDGTGQQSMHRDVLEGPGVVLTMQVPLVDLPSPNGGALSLMPGSHMAEGGDECDASAAVIATMPRAGTVILYDARTCHGGAANTRVPGDRPVLYLLLKQPTARMTGYAPFELNLRFGAAGHRSVMQYRQAFRRRFSMLCGGYPNQSLLWEEEHALIAHPLASISPYLLRHDS